jgi:hypothetical protein
LTKGCDDPSDLVQSADDRRREFDYIREAVASGRISGDGSFTRRCHEVLEEVTARVAHL